MRTVLLFVASFLVVLSSARFAAGQEFFLYGLTEGGHLTVNGTVLDALSSKVKSSSPVFSIQETSWLDMIAEDSNRWALRADGRVSKNGSKLLDLPLFSIFTEHWVSMSGESGGHFWALRSDGLLSKDGVSVINFPAEVECPPDPDPDPEGGGEGDPPPVPCFTVFSRVLFDGTVTWCLRRDGAVFRWPGTPEPVFQLSAGPGLDPELGEGQALDTRWLDMAINPTTGDMLCLRADGKLVRIVPAAADPMNPPSGMLLASLPFVGPSNQASLYMDLEFTSDRFWWALRGDGAVFNQTALVDPVIELPGNPLNNFSNTYTDLLPLDTNWFTTRWDGRVYALSGGVEETVTLAKDRYRRLAVSSEPPDLTNFKNKKPQVTNYAVQAVTGTAFAFPVLATDTDKRTEDLIVMVDAKSLPPGAVWDAINRIISWDNPGPAGKYKIVSFTDDLIAKPVKRVFNIRVRDPDDDPERNKKPRAGTIKKARALVGLPFELPILASDEDGDDLSWSVDISKAPFTLGATFDTKTATFAWDGPEGRDIGKYKVVFMVTDGVINKPVKRKVTIQVQSSILAF
jgi:hypothetical protein